MRSCAYERAHSNTHTMYRRTHTRRARSHGHTPVGVGFVVNYGTRRDRVIGRVQGAAQVSGARPGARLPNWPLLGRGVVRGAASASGRNEMAVHRALPPATQAHARPAPRTAARRARPVVRRRVGARAGCDAPAVRLAVRVALVIVARVPPRLPVVAQPHAPRAARPPAGALPRRHDLCPLLLYFAFLMSV